MIADAGSGVAGAAVLCLVDSGELIAGGGDEGTSNGTIRPVRIAAPSRSAFSRMFWMRVIDVPL
jgi:hypothetical protein